MRTIDRFPVDQYGLVTRRQALGAGISERQIQRHLQSEQWVRVRSGVYRVAAVAPTWESALLGAVIERQAVASHRCAAALWHLEIYTNPPVEFTVAHRTHSNLRTHRVHQSRQWELRSEIERRGIPCTGIDRTILDCCAVMSLRTAERLAEAAIRKRLTSWTELTTCLMRHSAHGRDGCGTLRALLEIRLGDQTIPLSDFSRLVANLLTDNGLPKPVLEYPIRSASGQHIFAADLAWPRLKKAWELDGLAFHFGRDEIERDKRKRNRAKAEGWAIQEILWSMYVNDPGGLVDLATRFLAT